MEKIPALFILLSTVTLLSYSGMSNTAFAEMALAEINYTIKVGEEKFLTNFTGCAGDQDIRNPKVITETPQQVKEIPVRKMIAANTCQTYEIVVDAKHETRISVEVK